MIINVEKFTFSSVCSVFPLTTDTFIEVAAVNGIDRNVFTQRQNKVFINNGLGKMGDWSI